jgi:predicted nucleotidyltransferase
MHNNKEKILLEIIRKPTYKFHIRELAKLTALNPNTVINLTSLLIREGVVKREEKKHLTEIYFNFENPQAIMKKRLLNLKNIYESGILDILIKEYEPEAIVLMGSYSRGEDLERSDIDLAMITRNSKIIGVEKFEKILSRKIHLLPIQYKEISEEFYTNLINGVILYGYIKRK